MRSSDAQSKKHVMRQIKSSGSDDNDEMDMDDSEDDDSCIVISFFLHLKSRFSGRRIFPRFNGGSCPSALAVDICITF